MHDARRSASSQLEDIPCLFCCGYSAFRFHLFWCCFSSVHFRVYFSRLLSTRTKSLPACAIILARSLTPATAAAYHSGAVVAALGETPSRGAGRGVVPSAARTDSVPPRPGVGRQRSQRSRSAVVRLDYGADLCHKSAATRRRGHAALRRSRRSAGDSLHALLQTDLAGAVIAAPPHPRTRSRLTARRRRRLRTSAQFISTWVVSISRARWVVHEPSTLTVICHYLVVSHCAATRHGGSPVGPMYRGSEKPSPAAQLPSN